MTCRVNSSIERSTLACSGEALMLTGDENKIGHAC